MKTDMTKCIWLVAFPLFLVEFDQALGRVPLPSYLTNRGNRCEERCQYEGEKVPHPDFGDKLFLCHFHYPTKKWLLFPFACAEFHRFDAASQRCLRFEVVPNGKGHHLITYETFPDEGRTVEIPDPAFTSDSEIFRCSEKSAEKVKVIEKGRSSVKGKSAPRDDCGESLRSLSSTIASLSKTIEKMSSKINAVPLPTNNNATISVRLPDLLTLNELLKSGQYQALVPKIDVETESPKPEVNSTKPLPEYRFVETNGTVGPLPKIVSETFREPFPFVTPVTLATTQRAVTTVSPSSTPLPEPSEHGLPNPQYVRPGGSAFMDFLFKNLLSPPPFRTPSPVHQIPKIPFQMNRPTNHGVFQPLPFRPRPPTAGFYPHRSTPQGGATTPAPPAATFGPTRAPPFVNMLTFLQNLKLDDSEEEEDITSDEWNGISGIFSPTAKTVPIRIPETTVRTPVSSTPPTVSFIPSTVVTQYSSSHSGSTSPPSPSAVPTTTAHPRSSDFTEFDNNDDEVEEVEDDEEGQEASRLNNRKPRRV